MAKGAVAKENVVNIVKQAFGENYVGDDGKKFYVWSEEGGEPVQVAIALTCPKVPYGTDATPAGAVKVNNGFDWSMGSQEQAPASQVEITEDEKANIARLMESLGL